MGTKSILDTVALAAALGHGAASAAITSAAVVAPNASILGVDTASTDFDYRVPAPQLQMPGTPILLASKKGAPEALDVVPQASASPQPLSSSSIMQTPSPTADASQPQPTGPSTTPSGSPSPSNVLDAQKKAGAGQVGTNAKVGAAIIGGVLVITNTKNGTGTTGSTGSQ